jgi:hypothetical protein
VGGTQDGSNITLALGQSATCTITNDDNAPSLTLKKVVINDDGRTSQPTAWILMAEGPTTFSGMGPSVSNGASFDAGTYTLSESGPLDYAPSVWSCVYTGTTTAVSATDAKVTVGLGEDITCTITNDDVDQTGALLPTQTTCEMYRDDKWPPMYSAFTYQAKGNKIISLSPGVIFYYNTITAPESGSISVQETNTIPWKPMLIQDLGQAILYTTDCRKASGVKVTASGTNPYTVTFSGAVPGQEYIIGIKYSPQNLVGQVVTKGATSTYSWSTYFGVNYVPGSGTSIPVAPKKK